MTVKPTATYPKSRWTARSHARHRFQSGIPLFLPRIGVVVVAALLPVAGLVVLDEADAGQPLRALPEVAIGDEAAHRRAVIDRQRLAVEAVRDERLIAHRDLERDVRREAVRRP